ncbi:hypothetical protein HNQ77_004514 [Silvibacterium bohemicum]|uniref:Uncharacterized protein n=1 Tax=Silvibacterium bohemicum TaxID=1577686 RepID=A0A841K0M8_9BACT|nr:hypothetical protein [Silvibacterium bohemicum]MBB6146535.1 hypothetical protein [Silvibacterium bohemicum]
MAGSTVYHSGSSTIPRPSSPVAYRPLAPVQAKLAAPPVYRPQGPAQTKLAASPLKPIRPLVTPAAAAPPVYRPFAPAAAQTKNAVSGGNAPAVYRPQTGERAASGVLQRAVPTHVGLPKPTPVVDYAPRGGERTEFEPKAHPRKTFSFGTNTRNRILSQPQFNPQFAGHRVISVRDSASGQQVNPEGVQLDHRVSWDTISKVMAEHNAQLHAQGKAFDPATYYTLKDAKLYYNDLENLHPALGALNASAGALGVQNVTKIHQGLEMYVGKVQAAWQNLQQGITSIGYLNEEEKAEGIAGRLHQIAHSMNELTEALF